MILRPTLSSLEPFSSSMTTTEEHRVRPRLEPEKYAYAKRSVPTANHSHPQPLATAAGTEVARRPSSHSALFSNGSGGGPPHNLYTLRQICDYLYFTYFPSLPLVSVLDRSECDYTVMYTRESCRPCQVTLSRSYYCLSMGPALQSQCTIAIMPCCESWQSPSSR
jgi:hypothetical protein